MADPRQVAFYALRDIHRRGAYADVALDRAYRQATDLSAGDRHLVAELVYGATRQQRLLDAIADRLCRKPAEQQPPDLRTILHLGFYQLTFLDRVPAYAIVNSSVELAKQNHLTGLAGFVNAVMRAAGVAQEQGTLLPQDADLGIRHSFPDWLVALWRAEYGEAFTAQLCAWFNQPPHIDLRVNPRRSSRSQVLAALEAAGIPAAPLPHLPQAIRLARGSGEIERLPGFAAGWWTVQDGSAQLVGHLLDPQPGERIVDACAAPGGKTTHLAELMDDRGTIYACDRAAKRLKTLQANCDRLGVSCVEVQVGDSCQARWPEPCDRVLLDAPCSGLGTLHRHADARWRQTPEEPYKLAELQYALLQQAATWVKPQGVIVYATCTLHPVENEEVVARFLDRHPQWAIVPPQETEPAAAYATPSGWVKILPPVADMDGFFAVRLQYRAPAER